jgi:hypothetical protein
MKQGLEEAKQRQEQTEEDMGRMQNAIQTMLDKMNPAELAQIKNDIGAINQRAASKQVKLAPLEKFDGTRTRLRSFLAAAQIHLDVNAELVINDAAKVSFVAAHFTGNAMDWFEAYLTDWKYTMEEYQNQETKAIFASYEYFKKKLELAFGDVDAERTAERRINSLKQTGSVGAYISLFQQHANKIQWDDHALMSRFHSGLKMEIRKELSRMEKPENLAKYYEAAKRIDDNLYLWKMEEREYQPARRTYDRGDPMDLSANIETRPQRRLPRPRYDGKDGKKEKYDKPDKSKVTCYNCDKKGHFARDCRAPKKERNGHGKRTEAIAANKEHNQTHWTKCTQDTCQTHTKLKEATGYWPKKQQHTAAATLEDRTKRWIDEALEDSESESDQEMDTPSQTQDNDTVRAETPEPVADWLKGFRRGNTEYEITDVPAEAHEKKESKGTLGKIFHERYAPGRDLMEVYEEWKHQAPRETRLSQFKRWVRINKVIDKGELSSQEWETAIQIIRETETYTGREVPVRYWIPMTPRRMQALGWQHEVLKGDDPRMEKGHVAHYEISWASCIQPMCDMHKKPKQQNNAWPRRQDKEPITRPLGQQDTHGWRVQTRTDGDVTLIPGELLPDQCIRGRKWYDCTANKCPKHVEQKIKTKHWPKDPTLAGTGGNHLMMRGRYHGKKVNIMIDSGATRNFISKDFVENKGIPYTCIREPYDLRTIEGLTFQNSVTHETQKGKLEIPGAVRETQFDITRIAEGQDIILGLPWLEKENPQIDWKKQTVSIPSGNPNVEYLAAMAREAAREEFPKGEVLCHVPQEYRHFLKIFNEPKEYKPQHHPWDHEINLEPGKEPRWGPIYRLTEEETIILEKQIDEGLKKGWMRESSSPAAHPILFVKKKGTHDLRLCVDYRTLNDITIKDRYPLPLISELQDQLQGAVIFTRLDIKNAYHHIRIKEGDEWKTAFRTKFGLYEYLVMPFGLTNAPATFQKRINKVLRLYLGKFCMAYLDDILIYSKNKEEHRRHVEWVLKALTDAQLYLKERKCEFNVERTTFLGFIVEPGQLRIDPEKLAAIRDWPTPKNITEVQSFLGFCNFVRKFIRAWSDLSLPLTGLLKKDANFRWHQAQEEGFKQIKKEFQKEPILKIYDPAKPPIMEADASYYAISAVLFQLDENGNKFPVAYHARKMTPPELNYDIYDKELLAIVVAFKEWRAYLQGARFPTTVYSDHKNLTGFMTTKELSPRQVRWAQFLATFDFKIIHTRGTENRRADALSRRPDFQGTEHPSGAILTRTQDGALIYNHPTLAATIEAKESSWIQLIRNATDDIPEEIGTIETQINDGLIKAFDRIYVPQRIRKEFIRQFHEAPAHGHQGIEKTLERILDQFYFPKARQTVTKTLRECTDCHRNKSSRHSPYGLLVPTETPEGPWEVVMMDFIVKLPKSKDHMTKEAYDSILTITEKLTKYTYFIPYREATSAEQMAATFVERIIATHGTPSKIITDRDVKFTSKFWQTIIKHLGIHHAMSTSFHPQTDGQTERMNQTVEQYLRNYLNYRQNNWVPLLPMAQFAYNSSTHSMTGVTPFLANHGYEPKAYRIPKEFSSWVPTAKERIDVIKQTHDLLKKDALFIQETMKKYYDKKRKDPPLFEEGEKVWLIRRNIKSKRPNGKLDHVKIGPYEIEKAISPVNYRLKLPKNMKVHPTFHVALLEKAPQDAKPAAYEADTYGDTQEWEFEKIKGSETRNGKKYYLIQWSGKDSQGQAWDDTWEPEENLSPEDLRKYPQYQTLAGTQEKRPPAPPLPQEGRAARRHEQRCLRRLSRLHPDPAVPLLPDPSRLASPLPLDDEPPAPVASEDETISHEQPPPYDSLPLTRQGLAAAPLQPGESVSLTFPPTHPESPLPQVNIETLREDTRLRSLIGSTPALQEDRIPERRQAEHALLRGVSLSETMQTSPCLMQREQDITIMPLRRTRSERLQRLIVLREGGMECELTMTWPGPAPPLYQTNPGITLGPRALEGRGSVTGQDPEELFDPIEPWDGEYDEYNDYQLDISDDDLGEDAYHNMAT